MILYPPASSVAPLAALSAAPPPLMADDPCPSPSCYTPPPPHHSQSQSLYSTTLTNSQSRIPEMQNQRLQHSRIQPSTCTKRPKKATDSNRKKIRQKRLDSLTASRLKLSRNSVWI
ncbi:hypothetical protein ACLB2K_019677 [Fragaria x ananassa]